VVGRKRWMGGMVWAGRHLAEHARQYARDCGSSEEDIGSIRRDCLDRLIVMNAAGLHRLLTN